MNLLSATMAGKAWRGRLEAGLHEVAYEFQAPGFDPDSLYFTVDGQRSGPWDYAPAGSAREGDCLLPSVVLNASTHPRPAHARVFVPRQAELDARRFNGRVGFRLPEAGEVELALTADCPARWRSARIERVADFSDETLTPNDFAGTGRWFLDDADVASLRARWEGHPVARAADAALDDCARFAPPRTQDEANHVLSRFLSTREPYGDDVIFWGNYLALLSLRTLVFARPEDGAQLLRWADALADIPVWGRSADPNGHDHDNDLTAALDMTGLTIALNWHAARFGDDRCARLRRKIAHQGRALRAWAVASRSSWPGTASQNHAYYGYGTLVFAGAALLRDPEHAADALDFLRIGAAAFRRFADALPPDGTYHEGVGYIPFGLAGLVPPLLLLERLTGRPFVPEDWFTAHYAAMDALAPAAPGWGLFWDDSNNVFPCWLPMALRHQTRAPSAAAREAAGRLLSKHAVCRSGADTSPRALATNFWSLTLAPDAPRISPPTAADPDAGAPRAHLLPDGGYASYRHAPGVRSYFHTAPPHGHAGFPRERHTYAYGHHHPDSGNVTLWADGRWILAATGYTLKKSSAIHNVLVVDGHGQYNDHYPWLPPPPWGIRPERVVMDGESDTLDAHLDLACFYPPELGLRHWRRRVRATPSALAVEDDIALARPATPSLRWISECAWTPLDERHVDNAGGWRLSLDLEGPAARQTVCEIRPCRRITGDIGANRAAWHGLCLECAEPATRWRVTSTFRPSQDAPEKPS